MFPLSLSQILPTSRLTRLHSALSSQFLSLSLSSLSLTHPTKPRHCAPTSGFCNSCEGLSNHLFSE